MRRNRWRKLASSDVCIKLFCVHALAKKKMAIGVPLVHLVHVCLPFESTFPCISISFKRVLTYFQWILFLPFPILPDHGLTLHTLQGCKRVQMIHLSLL